MGVGEMSENRMSENRISENIMLKITEKRNAPKIAVPVTVIKQLPGLGTIHRGFQSQI